MRVRHEGETVEARFFFFERRLNGRQGYKEHEVNMGNTSCVVYVYREPSSPSDVTRRYYFINNFHLSLNYFLLISPIYW
jgi:hypothetical protein